LASTYNMLISKLSNLIIFIVLILTNLHVVSTQTSGVTLLSVSSVPTCTNSHCVYDVSTSASVSLSTGSRYNFYNPNNVSEFVFGLSIASETRYPSILATYRAYYPTASYTSYCGCPINPFILSGVCDDYQSSRYPQSPANIGYIFKSIEKTSSHCLGLNAKACSGGPILPGSPLDIFIISNWYHRSVIKLVSNNGTVLHIDWDLHTLRNIVLGDITVNFVGALDHEHMTSNVCVVVDYQSAKNYVFPQSMCNLPGQFDPTKIGWLQYGLSAAQKKTVGQIVSSFASIDIVNCQDNMNSISLNVLDHSKLFSTYKPTANFIVRSYSENMFNFNDRQVFGSDGSINGSPNLPTSYTYRKSDVYLSTYPAVMNATNFNTYARNGRIMVVSQQATFPYMNALLYGCVGGNGQCYSGNYLVCSSPPPTWPVYTQATSPTCKGILIASFNEDCSVQRPLCLPLCDPEFSGSITFYAPHWDNPKVCLNVVLDQTGFYTDFSTATSIFALPLSPITGLITVEGSLVSTDMPPALPFTFTVEQQEYDTLLVQYKTQAASQGCTVSGQYVFSTAFTMSGSSNISVGTYYHPESTSSVTICCGKQCSTSAVHYTLSRNLKYGYNRTVITAKYAANMTLISLLSALNTAYDGGLKLYDYSFYAFIIIAIAVASGLSLVLLVLLWPYRSLMLRTFKVLMFPLNWIVSVMLRSYKALLQLLEQRDTKINSPKTPSARILDDQSIDDEVMRLRKTDGYQYYMLGDLREIAINNLYKLN